jgi:UDP-N-acetylmuramoyl-tripeptide--D-alanyl-D-alanine ligase
MKLSFLAQVVNGSCLGDDIEHSSSCYSTDTRSLKKGDIFVALRGKSFDGHNFISEAFQVGAEAAIVDKKFADKNSVEVLGKSILVVEDTLIAYGKVAALHVESVKARRVAITGSCGKTSVKEILLALLSEKGKVLATEANFNNEVGVPLTLLSIDETHDFAVIEMGASRPGDIAYLSGLASADVVTVLNADRAHIEGFGSIEGVAKTKGEIFSGAKRGGRAVLSMDEKFFPEWSELAKTYGLTVVTCSMQNDTADIYLQESQFNRKGFVLIVNVQGTVCEIELPLLGEHNIKNALIAIGIAQTLGLKTSEISSGFKNVKAAKGRLNVIPFKNKFFDSVQVKQSFLIDDSYNANPLSVKAAIDVLSAYTQTRILILGDMAELGADEKAMHQEMGDYAKEKQIDVLLTCGALSNLAFDNFSGKGKAYTKQEDLIKDLPNWLQEFESAVFLVKGSRSSEMNKVVSAMHDLGEVA